MSVSTLYGINGVGKETVGFSLKERRPSLRVMSESRILMALLGIIPDPTYNYSLSRDHYKDLESVPQEQMIKLESGPYREFVQELANDADHSLILSHLVFALYLDKKIQYLTDRYTPQWYIACNTALVQVTAPPVITLARRSKDQNARERVMNGLDEIKVHQSYCDEKWDTITNISDKLGSSNCHVLENINLSLTTTMLEGIIYEH